MLTEKQRTNDARSSAVRQRRGASLEVTNPMFIASTLMNERPRFTARDFRPNRIKHPLSLSLSLKLPKTEIQDKTSF